jgi:phosphoribosylformylglycinamidine synthase subunit PurL
MKYPLPPEFLRAQASGFGLKPNEFEMLEKRLSRSPSLEELAVTGALWSEHCSYKSSRVHLKRFHTEEPWVWQGPGENAGVVGITENWGVAFKMESHNHPSYIEPYQGAATGVGGILRDVFCMGAWPIASMNSLRFGASPWNTHCLKRVVEGIADYGNSVGVPTVHGDLSFHPAYTKNILVNAFNAGLIHKNKIFRGVLTTETSTSNTSQVSHCLPGTTLTSDLKNKLFPAGSNLIVYFGQATGRDGVHGATMSSAEFSSGVESLKPTVQVGDPFAERKLMEATRALIESGKVVGLQDMGAAGLTSSSVEMAGRSGCGVAIDLQHVPQRARNLQAYELLLSESQERMLCAVAPEHLEAVRALLEPFDVSFAVIGNVNTTGQFVCVFDNTVCVNIDVPTLVDEAPKYSLPVASEADYANFLGKKETKRIEKSKDECFFENHPTTLDLRKIATGDFLETKLTLLEGLFAHREMASRAPLFQHYCATVQGQTIAGSGALQEAAAGVVRLPDFAQEPKGADVGIALATGCEERWVEWNPLLGSQHAVLRVARKVVAAGGKPLALTDCLNFGSPIQPVVMKQLSDTVDGITLVSKTLKLPVVSGNVSLNNQTDGEPIPPTPMIGIVGKVNNTAHVRKSKLSRSGRSAVTTLQVYWLNHNLCEPNQHMAIAPWIWSHGAQGNVTAPNLNAEGELWDVLLTHPELQKVDLAVPVGHGGALSTLCRMAFENKFELGFEPAFLKMSAAQTLGEGQAGFLIATTSKAGALEDLRKDSRFKFELVASLKNTSSGGTSTGSTSLTTSVFGRFQKTYENWQSGLRSAFPSKGGL